MNKTHPHQPIEILLIDDNPGDVELTRLAFARGMIANRITVACDGLHGLQILRREPPYTNAPRPDLILLDLNMPRMNGHEFLQAIKAEPVLMRIPVVVLTSSTTEQDVLRSYDLHANSFVTKPVGLKELEAVVRLTEGFWFQVVTLPEPTAPHASLPKCAVTTP